MLLRHWPHEYSAGAAHPHLDTRKAVDMRLLPGTPMMPDNAAPAMWVRNPHDDNDGIFVSINTNLTPYILYSARQNDFSSIALVVNDTALSTPDQPPY